MKKYFMFLAAVLCCAMTATMLTACGSDDDDNNGGAGGGATAEILGIGGDYTISVTEQMAQLCDYTITYYGEDNKLVTEKMTWTVDNGVATWNKSVNTIVLPAKFGAKVQVSIKKDAQLENVNITNVYILSATVSMLGVTKDGKMAWNKKLDLFNGVSSSMSCSGEKLGEILEVINNRGGLLDQYFTVDKNGQKTDSGSI